MTVAFSESDITKVKVGQPATVTMDALSGVQLAGRITAIATGTTSSSVVSYDATITLDQLDPRVRPGMSASASVIVAQSDGVTLPNQALTGSGSTATVQLVQNGHTTSHPVLVGLRGTSRSVIVSGLSAGQQVAVTITLPSLGTSSATSGTTGTLGGGGGRPAACSAAAAVSAGAVADSAAARRPERRDGRAAPGTSPGGGPGAAGAPRAEHRTTARRGPAPHRRGDAVRRSQPAGDRHPGRQQDLPSARSRSGPCAGSP